MEIIIENLIESILQNKIVLKVVLYITYLKRIKPYIYNKNLKDFIYLFFSLLNEKKMIKINYQIE